MKNTMPAAKVAEKVSIGTLRTGRAGPRWTPDDLEPGDILVGRRVSSFHTLNRLSGDPWGHVGIIVNVNGELRTAEAAPRLGRFQRTPREFVASYRYAGAVRPELCPDCHARVDETTRSALDAELAYEPRAIFAAGLIAMLARWAPTGTHAAVSRAAARLARPWTEDGRTMCVGLILEAFATTCDECRPTFHPLLGRAGRSDVPAERPDPLASSPIFTTPSTIWRAAPSTHRHLVSLADEHTLAA